jgi:hypothetical protein
MLASHTVSRIHRAAEARDKQPWGAYRSRLFAGYQERFRSLQSAHCIRSGSTKVFRLL